MKLQQLRYLCEIVDHNLNLSDASETLHRAQPGVSRSIKELEDELGTKLFVRSGKRLTALTKAGEEILRMARRIVTDSDTVTRIGKEYSNKYEGDLKVATTHTHARYVLPKTIRAFISRYPEVRLSLRQGNPNEIASWISSGEADISIAAEPLVPVKDLVLVPCYDLHRVVLLPKLHALLGKKPLTLHDIAKYPMITYDASFTGRAQIAHVFSQAGLSPRVIMSATDADVMKLYVKMGIGIAVAASVVFDPQVDVDIRVKGARHLFPPNTIYVGYKRGAYLRSFAYDFISMFAPALSRKVIEAAGSKTAALPS